MIRPCEPEDLEAVWTIINDGAQAYRGVIPADRWHDPYMTREQLREEIEAGVTFWAVENEATLQGVMGIQDVQDVTLIRHAYVRTGERRKGIGGKLLSHLQTLTNRPVLIGTWADASWAIHFYQQHGFESVPAEQKDKLLRRYWKIPVRQIETSIVLFRGELPVDRY
jgi:N-acetylglutamate synthase-like GNAT family acetyltransferase